MTSPQTTHQTPTRIERLALAEYKKYLRKSGVGGMYLAINLEKEVREWLGLPAHAEAYGIDGMMPHEVLHLIGYIVSDFRTRWNDEAQKTRKRNRDKDRQRTFDFDSPLP